MREPIGTTGFTSTSVIVGDGSHLIEASDPIGIVITGYDHNVSYAYPGGLNLTAINPVE